MKAVASSQGRALGLITFACQSRQRSQSVGALRAHQGQGHASAALGTAKGILQLEFGQMHDVNC